jgi:NADP-dependent 3-hydroxy acid dehydrogenase YdfG
MNVVVMTSATTIWKKPAELSRQTGARPEVVTNRADFAAADATEARFGRSISCATTPESCGRPTDLANFADWDWVMGVNVGGTINGVTTMLPRILARRRRATSSTRLPCRHCACWRHDDLFHGKAAVVTMMECMRPELEAKGVICSAFARVPCSRTLPASKTRLPNSRHRRHGAAEWRQLLPSLSHQGTGRERAGGHLNDELYIPMPRIP